MSSKALSIEDAPRRPESFFASYSVELLYAEAPSLTATNLKEALGRSLREITEGSVELVSRDEPRASLSMAYRGALPDSGQPPEWRLEPLQLLSPSKLAAAKAQSWWWQEGRARVGEATAALRLSDHRDSTLDGARRIERFRRVLAAVQVALPSLAILWSPTQQLVDPDEFLESVREAPHDPLPGAINVRYFQVATQSADQDEEYLMDTLGLGALGLTDLQCHFRGLDPDSVSPVLFNTALYLIEHGPRISDGHTVAGPREDDRWLVTRRPALVEPERDILDLDPGFPFAGTGG